MAKYTDTDLICQTMVAFGQGAHDMRISHMACRAVLARYQPWIGEKKIKEMWEKEAVQILERIKALGRLAAAIATKKGRTAIQADDVEEAIPTMEKGSSTTLCVADIA
jgi:histone H3/H4